MTSSRKIWLITGAASGLGLAITERVLLEGDIVVATARNVERLSKLRQTYEGSLYLEELDVVSEADVQRVIRKTVLELGRIDVLVNNAGYGTLRPFEQTSSSSFRAEVDVNFFGTVNLIRATLPSMREKRSGVIINISSSAGRVGAPGMAAYCAAKAAVGVFTESLAKEAKPFGVRVVAVEPGSIRTGWASQALSGFQPLLPDYQETVGALLGYAKSIAGNEPGDPDKYADIIFRLARNVDLPEHLLLGPAAIQMVNAADRARQLSAAEWVETSIATDF